MDNDKLPTLDPVLIRALDARFPERCPEPTWTEREIWMRAGERRVVRLLLDQLRQQEEDRLADQILPKR